MKPVDQTKTLDNGQRGNCLAACLASVLETDLKSIPEFEELPPGQWKPALAEWAQSIRMKIVRKEPSEYNVGEHYVAVGISHKGNRHATVALNGEVVHCPHHSRAGIGKIDYIFTITPTSAS